MPVQNVSVLGMLSLVNNMEGSVAADFRTAEMAARYGDEHLQLKLKIRLNGVAVGAKNI